MIVVTTPTGNIGASVLRGLLQAGETVRVVARDPSRLPPEAGNRVEVVQGPLDDVRVLRQAFGGADALFWCVPQSNTLADVRDYYLRFGHAACAAIRAQGMPRVVAISSGGYGRARNAGPISALHAIDAMIEDTGTAFRALRNGSFMENLLWQLEPIRRQGMFFYPLGGDLKKPTCAARDIAAVAVRLLRDHAWTGCGGIGVHGPADLSFNDMALIMTEVLGKPVRFQEMPGPAYKAQLMHHGGSAAFAQGLVDMFAEVGQGIYQAEPRTVETTTPTTFHQWCEEVLRPAMAPR